MDVICPICTEKNKKIDKSGIYKHPEKDEKTWRVICLTCGWKTEPFFHHEDIKLPTKEELKNEWR